MQLYIFDFDDTLAITDSMIRLVRHGEEIMMDSHEFAGYRYQSGDILDFSDFDRVGGSLIDDTVAEMEEAIQGVGIENVFIVTARALNKPVSEWLQKNGIVSPEVVATAGSAGKAPWLIQKLNSGDYDKVVVYEDCQKNIRMLKDSVQQYNDRTGSSVAYSAMCILSDQSMVKVERRWRDENVITEDDHRDITRNFIQKMWK